MVAITASKVLSGVNNSSGTNILVLLYSLEISALPSALAPIKSHRCCCSLAFAVNFYLLSQGINLVLRALRSQRTPVCFFSADKSQSSTCLRPAGHSLGMELTMAHQSSSVHAEQITE